MTNTNAVITLEGVTITNEDVDRRQLCDGVNGDAANVISNGYTLYVNGVALTGTK